jgi:hypothetical protein
MTSGASNQERAKMALQNSSKVKKLRNYADEYIHRIAQALLL